MMQEVSVFIYYTLQYNSDNMRTVQKHFKAQILCASERIGASKQRHLAMANQFGVPNQ